MSIAEENKINKMMYSKRLNDFSRHDLLYNYKYIAFLCTFLFFIQRFPSIYNNLLGY